VIFPLRNFLIAEPAPGPARARPDDLPSRGLVKKVSQLIKNMIERLPAARSAPGNRDAITTGFRFLADSIRRLSIGRAPISRMRHCEIDNIE
jgi:hypothetical protein